MILPAGCIQWRSFQHAVYCSTQSLVEHLSGVGPILYCDDQPIAGLPELFSKVITMGREELMMKHDN